MKLHVLAPAVLTSALLSACGGGGGSSSDPAPTPTPAATTTVSGVATKGLLQSALVTAYKVNADGSRGAAITSKETDATGGYTLDLGTYTGPVVLEVTVVAGKTTTADEATGQSQSLPADFKLRSSLVVTAPATGNTQIQSASITPYTELATKIAEDSGGLSKTNIANATKVVFDLIGVDPVATKPIDFLSAAPSSATPEQKRYALLNAAVSTLAATAPTTTDPATLACFASAGTDAGKKIKCATDQIAKSVTVDKSGSTPTAAVNKNFVGLGDALVAASSDSKNKTGTTVTADDSSSKRLKDLETEVKNSSTGTAPPVKLDVPAQDQADVTTAKLFFSRLRANVASLQSAPLDTGVADGIRAFEASLNSEALAVTGQTGQLIRLADTAFTLWSDFKRGATTNPQSLPIAGLNGNCTVYSGDFPTQLGPVASQVGSDGLPGAAYPNTSVLPTSAADARWVICSVNSGVTPTLKTSATQYRRSIAFNMSASGYPGNVPYLAATRARFIDSSNTLVQRNLTPTLSGSVGYTTTSAGQINSLQLVGDLPPGVGSGGTLAAARFAVNAAGSVSQLSSGAVKVALTAGSFSVIPVGASAPSLTLDLSADAATAVVVPNVDPATAPSPAQLADGQITVAAKVSSAKGVLKGKLVADQFAVDALGDLQPNRLSFTGSLAAAGKAGAVAELLVGTLEGKRSLASGAAAYTKTVSFNGTLSLPSRPVVTLSLSVTDNPAAGTAVASTTLTGRYVQDAITLNITGTESAGKQAVTFTDSSAVSVSVLSSTDTAAVTVSGRAAASIDRQRQRIIYADGSFESLL